MTTCAQAIKEVFTSKDQIFTTKQIIDAVEKKYPSQWKEITIRTHTMGCSVNHTSNKHEIVGDVGERLTYQLMYVSDEICHEKHAYQGEKK